jgi:hypothetical protein
MRGVAKFRRFASNRQVIPARNLFPETSLPWWQTLAFSPKPSEASALDLGQVAPNFVLTDQDGQTIQLQDYRGQAVMVTFIFTRCPLPNHCPLMSCIQHCEMREGFGGDISGTFLMHSSASRCVLVDVGQFAKTPAKYAIPCMRYSCVSMSRWVQIPVADKGGIAA